MSEKTKLQKRSSGQIVKENVQYVLAFTVIAGMLIFTGLPVFVVFFFGVLGYFIWKTLSAPSTSGTREIFEFYLVANEILRDDERRSYGFEIQEAIARGENILRNMSGAPPLVSFAVGALYHKIGDHQSAVRHLAYVAENESSDETRFVYPSPELRSYVRTLRKIERDPAEAPLMSAAIRALERARRNRSGSLLESARAGMDREAIEASARSADDRSPRQIRSESSGSVTDVPARTLKEEFDEQYRNGTERPAPAPKKRSRRKSGDAPPHNGQSISEILRDIYDSKS